MTDAFTQEQRKDESSRDRINPLDDRVGPSDSNATMVQFTPSLDGLLQDAIAAVRRGELPRAFAVAEAGLQAGYRHPVLLKLRAASFEARGRPGEAAADFTAALAEAPDDFGALNALGLCLAKLGRQSEAVSALERALELQPTFAEAHFNLGWTFESTGRLQAAEQAYESAVRYGHLDAKACLAVLMGRRANWGQAATLGDEVLEIDPAHPTAAIAHAMVQLARDKPHVAEARLRTLLAEARLDAHSRFFALGLLGDALDRLTRFDEAFQAYEASNIGFRDRYGATSVGGRERGYDLPERLRAELAVLQEDAFRSNRTQPRSESPCASHVFLLGFPRSGTTLTGQILAAHPRVVTLDEEETLADAADAFLCRSGGLAEFAGLAHPALQHWRDCYWSRVRKAGINPDGVVFIDKLPMNTLGLPLIARLFPDAKVVFMQRHPNDVVLSCFRQRFVVNATNAEFYSLSDAARMFGAVMELAELYERRLDLAWRRQSFEALVQDFDSETAALCGFLGLPWDASMQNFVGSARAGAIATPSSAQIAVGLNAAGVGHWRNYTRYLESVRNTLNRWIDRFGYEGRQA